MKKILVLSVLFTASLNIFAQTKKIAHHSHSGKNSTLIMTTEDNFGIPSHANNKPVVVVAKDTLAKKTVPVKKKKAIKRKKKAATTK